MPLETGSRLGPYAIEAPLGAGGMGEVYRAKDTRLDRTVAIKVLPSHLSDRPELKERFEREAKAISSLNHPNICALYDVGHQDGIDFLVMEYLEGETLADRLAKGALSVPEVLKTGTQIAEALSVAHRSGVVHRDLKPGNVMIQKGTVKLLDFGLAKLGDISAKPGSGSLPGLTVMPTQTHESSLTQEGTLLGTFMYMSPEQLEGKEADSRSDIFALGSLLYEMATGRRAFSGDSQASLIASILREEPRAISEVAAMSPPALDRVVKTCMAKDPDDRWQTAHDVALQLEWIEEGGSQAGIPAPVAKRRRSRERLAWALAGIASVAAITLGALQVLNRTPAPEKQVLRYQIDLPKGSRSFADPRISPDGGMVSFTARDSTGNLSIWVQRLDALKAQPLPGTEDARTPFWSPDSRHLAYFTSAGRLKKVSVAGGPPTTIAAVEGADGSWGADGIILFDNGSTDSVMAIPAAGGNPYPATTIDRSLAGTGTGWPLFLPDGQQFLYMNLVGGTEGTTLMAGRLGSLEHRALGPVQSRFEYAPSGYLLYVQDGILLARPFDADRVEFTGEPVPVSEGVSAGGAFFEGDFSVSQNGILTYWEGNAASTNHLTWYRRDGARAGTIGSPGEIQLGALSPTEDRLLVAINDSRTDTPDLWMMDLVRGTTSRFTFDPARDIGPVWSPDGEQVLFTSTREGSFSIYQKQSNGAGNDAAFMVSPTPNGVSDWSRDGEWVIFLSFSGATRLDVNALSMSTGDTVIVANSSFNETSPRLSPDGDWIAYQSNESGADEIYVQAFPEAKGKYQISTAGGRDPFWSGDGTELYYLEPGDRLMRVEMATEAGFRAGTPELLFISEAGNNYIPTRDGSRFLFARPLEVRAQSPLNIVVNWATELETR